MYRFLRAVDHLIYLDGWGWRNNTPKALVARNNTERKTDRQTQTYIESTLSSL